jgi:hypothetical protein
MIKVLIKLTYYITPKLDKRELNLIMDEKSFEVWENFKIINFKKLINYLF